MRCRSFGNNRLDFCKNIRTACFVLVTIFGLSNLAFAQSDALSDEVQDRILKTANGICGEVIQKGGGKDLSVDGEASLELKGLARALGNAQIKGAAKFSDDDYINVLRENLPEELANVRECRFKVFQQLMQDVRKAQEQDSSIFIPDSNGSIENGPQVVFGIVNWGPYLNCVISNTANRPFNVKSINYQINWINGPQQVNQQCIYNCVLNAFSSNTFSGPPNNMNIVSSTCSVTVVYS